MLRKARCLALVAAALSAIGCGGQAVAAVGTHQAGGRDVAPTVLQASDHGTEPGARGGDPARADRWARVAITDAFTQPEEPTDPERHGERGSARVHLAFI